MLQPLQKTVWRFLKKLKIELPYDPAVLLLIIQYPEKKENTNSKRYMQFIAAVFTTAKIWKQPKCPPTDEWIKKMWCVYTMEYYTAVKKKKKKSCHLQQHEWIWRVLC